MNIRTKAFGLLAGSAIALSTVIGVSADDSVSVKLNNNPTGSCTPSIGEVSLGSYDWNGSKYSGTMTGNIVVKSTQTHSVDDVTCTYTISSTNLTGTGEDADVMLAEDITVTGVTDATNLATAGSFSVSTSTGEGDAYPIAYDLAPALAKAPSKDTYTGTITLTAVTIVP